VEADDQLSMVFGYQVYMKELGHVSKFADWSRIGVFTGYTEGVKVYHILDPTTRRVCTVCDIMFDEASG
jgi:hypothetical protein